MKDVHTKIASRAIVGDSSAEVGETISGTQVAVAKYSRLQIQVDTAVVSIRILFEQVPQRLLTDTLRMVGRRLCTLPTLVLRYFDRPIAAVAKGAGFHGRFLFVPQVSLVNTPVATIRTLS
jgi:hypothetical protein